MQFNNILDKIHFCDLNCEGIINDKKNGVPPRCLILEKQPGKNNCIVVGINPGIIRKKEQNYYKKNGIDHKVIHEYWEKEISKVSYYSRTKELLNCLNFDGNILWTELVKCQSKSKKIPLQTLRTCINNWLKKEINLFENQPIFALGNQAYEYCALSFPNNTIIGLPHPSGPFSNNKFIKLIKKVKQNPKEYLNKINNNKNQAIKLDNYTF
ncbi:MAG: uracil-DNA glycosylase family protein [Candidatus ainarchaeum sp.]|nr:uracil-DNA glycosylase family protein [Candidatus ainarchaeum sp.]